MPCGHARTADVSRLSAEPIPPWAGPGSETGAMKGTLTQNGTDTEATTENVLAALAGKQFFWLDLDDDASDGIGGEGESVAPEPVDRDRDLDMLQEASQPIRIIGIVTPRSEVESQSARLDNRVVRGTGLLGSSAGNLVRTPVL